MNLTIDIDKDLADTRLSLRERVAIKILLVIFRIVLPCKYDHQIAKALAPLGQLIGDDK